MKVFSAKYANGSVEFGQWKTIDSIIRTNLPKDMLEKAWRTGYDGLFPFVPAYFGMNRMYRSDKSYITYEFTDEQWTAFLLRWA